MRLNAPYFGGFRRKNGRIQLECYRKTFSEYSMKGEQKEGESKYPREENQLKG